MARAPKLIPVLQHRYLVAEPCYGGNPVLSVWQSDIVVYGVDLRNYFFNQFPVLIGPARQVTVPDEATTLLRAIPFWGEFLRVRSA